MYLSIHLLKDILKWSRSVVSNSLRPHGLQPTRLLSPWDFPGKKNGLGCHLSRYEALFCQLWIKLLLTSVCKVLCGYKFQLLCNYQGAWLPNHMVVDVQFSKKYSNNLSLWSPLLLTSYLVPYLLKKKKRIPEYLTDSSERAITHFGKREFIS